MSRSTPVVGREGKIRRGDTILGRVGRRTGWHGWLNSRYEMPGRTATWRFEGENGSFTAVPKGRSGRSYYWNAQRRMGGKLKSVYLGKSEDLDMARLERIAGKLSQMEMKIDGLERADARQVAGEQATLFGEKNERDHNYAPEYA